MTETSAFAPNLFEIENARNLNTIDLVETFVPTPAFRRLLSAKNQILLGSRGSGKTALIRMLSLDHLARLDDPEARECVRQKRLAGIYVPTRLEWVGGLRNKEWQNSEEAERCFQWRVNIAASLAFLRSIRSWLDTYFHESDLAVRREHAAADALGELWCLGASGRRGLRGLQRSLENLEHEKHIAYVRSRMGLESSSSDAALLFGGDLFSPVQTALRRLDDILDIPAETSWLICVDEAELLDVVQQRVLNSRMRAFGERLFVKVATMPYGYSLDTNVGSPLDNGHDFEFVYIDHDRSGWGGEAGADSEVEFARAVFEKRARRSGTAWVSLSLTSLLGPSPLLEPEDGGWDTGGGLWTLLERYGAQETIKRARTLRTDEDAFKDQIARKVGGALRLRDAVERARGRVEVEEYSGERLAIRCTDGNPRRIVRLLNRFFLEVQRQRAGGSAEKVSLTPREQSRILLKYSSDHLRSVRWEPQVGEKLFEFISALGEYMRCGLHERPLTTDPVLSVRVPPSVSDEAWWLVARGVNLGLLYPNLGPTAPDDLPLRQGRFRLGYVLAPYFRLMPRRGQARDLGKMVLVGEGGIRVAGGRSGVAMQEDLFEGGET